MGRNFEAIFSALRVGVVGIEWGWGGIEWGLGGEGVGGWGGTGYILTLCSQILPWSFSLVFFTFDFFFLFFSCSKLCNVSWKRLG